ncbi:MAG: hypothetical protein IRY97_11080 [Thermomicrobiaceae bacterium]|nr:hypothetical protein [Thermomicrobiaceae bacterium]
MNYFLKTQRGEPAAPLDEQTGREILDRGRHAGRRVVEVYALEADGRIERYQERARRKLGSNAIVSRTWLCETYQPGAPEQWGNDRYVPNPEEALQETTPPPQAIVLVLLGAEGDSDQVVEQLTSLQTAR